MVVSKGEINGGCHKTVINRTFVRKEDPVLDYTARRELIKNLHLAMERKHVVDDVLSEIEEDTAPEVGEDRDQNDKESNGEIIPWRQVSRKEVTPMEEVGLTPGLIEQAFKVGVDVSEMSGSDAIDAIKQGEEDREEDKAFILGAYKNARDQIDMDDHYTWMFEFLKQVPKKIALSWLSKRIGELEHDGQYHRQITVFGFGKACKVASQAKTFEE